MHDYEFSSQAFRDFPLIPGDTLEQSPVYLRTSEKEVSTIQMPSFHDEGPFRLFALPFVKTDCCFPIFGIVYLVLNEIYKL